MTSLSHQDPPVLTVGQLAKQLGISLYQAKIWADISYRADDNFPLSKIDEANIRQTFRQSTTIALILEELDDWGLGNVINALCLPPDTNDSFRLDPGMVSFLKSLSGTPALHVPRL
ncbi:hypothetical protein A3B57_02550 [Microgenomates group bacterium RIFCSPLOWO2_01_FULL_47_10]|nr:MAG: hypothetical protein A3B57_02550 [Microgenomates group bacterium RIFCSPLOWO2_01_FULL_47_10]